MVDVYSSKHTPGITASDTRFDVGEVVTYRLLKDGMEVQVQITSRPMIHPDAPGDKRGYGLRP